MFPELTELSWHGVAIEYVPGYATEFAYFCTNSSISTGTIRSCGSLPLARGYRYGLNLDVRCVELSVPCSLGNDSGVCRLEHWLGPTALFLRPVEHGSYPVQEAFAAHRACNAWCYPWRWVRVALKWFPKGHTFVPHGAFLEVGVHLCYKFWALRKQTEKESSVGQKRHRKQSYQDMSCAWEEFCFLASLQTAESVVQDPEWSRRRSP